MLRIVRGHSLLNEMRCSLWQAWFAFYVLRGGLADGGNGPGPGRAGGYMGSLNPSQLTGSVLKASDNDFFLSSTRLHAHRLHARRACNVMLHCLIAAASCDCPSCEGHARSPKCGLCRRPGRWV